MASKCRLQKVFKKMSNKDPLAEFRRLVKEVETLNGSTRNKLEGVVSHIEKMNAKFEDLSAKVDHYHKTTLEMQQRLDQREQELIDAIENARKAQDGFLGLDRMQKEADTQQTGRMSELHKMMETVMAMRKERDGSK